MVTPARRPPRALLVLLAGLLLAGLIIGVVSAWHGGRGPLSACAPSGVPAQVQDTEREIDDGAPYPYREDGTTFDNREQVLPSEPRGYYREFTVVTPGSGDRGARRVVAGGGTPTDPARLYYTGDHYASFCLLAG